MEPNIRLSRRVHRGGPPWPGLSWSTRLPRASKRHAEQSLADGVIDVVVCPRMASMNGLTTTTRRRRARKNPIEEMGTF
jgi:hypothetical protein